MAVQLPSTRGGQVEKFAPGDRITCTVAVTAVVGGRLVQMNGNRTIEPAGANSTKVLGVAMYDGAVAEKVTVATEGVWLLQASGAIAAGDLVVAGAAGVVVALAAAGGAYVQAEANATRAIVGRALEAISNGALGPIKLGAI